MSSPYGEVQRQDWQDRDFIEIVSRNIKKITDFLNHFDQSCRGKIAELNEKVTHLERQIDFLEASINGQAATSVSAVGGGDVRLQQQPQPQHPSVGIVMQTPQQQGQAQQ